MAKHGTGSDGQAAQGFLKQTTGEEILGSEQLQIDRKKLVLTLKKNRRGGYLRISEQAGSHQNTIIFSADGIRDVIRVLDQLARRAGR
jgi:PurA ssDNA and RNA-binding protein